MSLTTTVHEPCPWLQHEACSGQPRILSALLQTTLLFALSIYKPPSKRVATSIHEKEAEFAPCQRVLSASSFCTEDCTSENHFNFSQCSLPVLHSLSAVQKTPQASTGTSKPYKWHTYIMFEKSSDNLGRTFIAPEGGTLCRWKSPWHRR